MPPPPLRRSTAALVWAAVAALHLTSAAVHVPVAASEAAPLQDALTTPEYSDGRHKVSPDPAAASIEGLDITNTLPLEAFDATETMKDTNPNPEFVPKWKREEPAVDATRHGLPRSIEAADEALDLTPPLSNGDVLLYELDEFEAWFSDVHAPTTGESKSATTEAAAPPLEETHETALVQENVASIDLPPRANEAKDTLDATNIEIIGDDVDRPVVELHVTEKEDTASRDFSDENGAQVQDQLPPSDDFQDNDGSVDQLLVDGRVMDVDGDTLDGEARDERAIDLVGDDSAIVVEVEVDDGGDVAVAHGNPYIEDVHETFVDDIVVAEDNVILDDTIVTVTTHDISHASSPSTSPSHLSPVSDLSWPDSLHLVWLDSADTLHDAADTMLLALSDAYDAFLAAAADVSSHAAAAATNTHQWWRDVAATNDDVQVLLRNVYGFVLLLLLGVVFGSLYVALSHAPGVAVDYFGSLDEMAKVQVKGAAAISAIASLVWLKAVWWYWFGLALLAGFYYWSGNATTTSSSPAARPTKAAIRRTQSMY
ncbi:Aste57867_19057 [Aphanomyces stellatus]|uniref:Aste57867_19057 protein n=1 Tax=Aphanomyces stellatus TaxID=120398 RepID=A0A485LCA2_9STRA|nr:hypothetical protein As57867_018993 [Aphanomyces stellatus]VFT95782.1 Aste57867_19057 [Aphanomyces stellatus]